MCVRGSEGEWERKSERVRERERGGCIERSASFSTDRRRLKEVLTGHTTGVAPAPPGRALALSLPLIVTKGVAEDVDTEARTLTSAAPRGASLGSSLEVYTL